MHRGVAPYLPNSLGGGCPFTVAQDAFIDVPQKLPASRRMRENPVSFADHHSQAGLFYRSLAPVERDHVVGAYTFELAHVFEQSIRERQLQQLALIDGELGAAVAGGLGLAAPASEPVASEPASSAALSMIGRRWPVGGRKVGVVVASGPCPEVPGLLATLRGAGLAPVLIAPAGGTVEGEVVQRSYLTALGPELDAVLVASPTPPAPDARPSLDAKASGQPAEVDPRVVTLLEQAWRHAKPLGALEAAAEVLAAAGVDAAGAGVQVGSTPHLVDALVGLLAAHRVWDRFEPASQ